MAIVRVEYCLSFDSVDTPNLAPAEATVMEEHLTFLVRGIYRGEMIF